jgi:hypothetical protein
MKVIFYDANGHITGNADLPADYVLTMTPPDGLSIMVTEEEINPITHYVSGEQILEKSDYTPTWNGTILSNLKPDCKLLIPSLDFEETVFDTEVEIVLPYTGRFMTHIVQINPAYYNKQLILQ